MNPSRTNHVTNAINTPSIEQINAGLDQLKSDTQVTPDEMAEAYKAMVAAADLPDGVAWADSYPAKAVKKPKSIYPFWTMLVGQYFVPPYGCADSCRVIAQRITKTGKRIFEVERFGDDGQVRIYRIK